MVLEALPDAIRLGRQIFRPGSMRGQEAEPSTLWERVSNAKSEILILLVDAATVLLQAITIANTVQNTVPEIGSKGLFLSQSQYHGKICNNTQLRVYAFKVCTIPIILIVV